MARVEPALLSFADRAAQKLGVGSRPLDVGELLSQAERRARRRFRDRSFEPALEKFIESCEGEAALSVFGRVSLELLELQLHLIEQAAAALGAGAILLALELGDLQLEVSDQRLDGALAGMGVGQLGLCFVSLLERGNQQRLERFNIVRKGRDDGFHGPE